MTDCGCDKAKAELEEYLHRELSDQDFRDVTEHLVGITMTAKMQKACQEKAPDELRSAILSQLS